MKKLFFARFFFFLFLFPPFGVIKGGCQTGFQRIYGNPSYGHPRMIRITTDSGYVMAGTMYNFVSNDVYVLKTDANGNVQFSKTYGGTASGQDEYAYDIKQTTDGGYIVTGRTTLSDADNDVYLLKLDASGVLQWSKTFGCTNTDWGDAVLQSSDGGYIICGQTFCSAALGNAYLIKTDSNGNMQWTKTYGGSATDEEFYEIQETFDGGYIMTGWTSSFGAGGFDMFLVKTDTSGTVLWSKIFGGTGNDFGTRVRQTSNGGYAISGYTDSFGTGSNDMYLVRTDAGGNLIWSETIGNSLGELAFDLQIISSGYVLSGYSNLTSTDRNAVLIKTDTTGTVQWAMQYGDSLDDTGMSLKQTSDGGFIVGAYTTSFAWNPHIYLIKTDSLGNSGCNESAISLAVTVPATIESAPSYTVNTMSFTGNPASIENNLTLWDTTLCGSSGCSLSASITNTTNTNCGDSTGTATVIPTNGASPFTYNWSNGQTTQTATGLAIGNYLVTVTDSAGCSDTANATISAANAPLVSLGNDTNFCTGNDLVLDAGNIGSTYLWQNNSTAQTLTASSTGQYFVVVTDTNGCSASDTINIIVVNNFNATITSSLNYCVNGIPVILTGADGGGTWTGNGITNSSTGEFNPAVAGIGNHQIIYTISGSCGDADTVTITVNNAPVVSLGNDTNICTGNNLVLDAGNSGSSYLWQDGSTAQTFIVNDTGQYYVEVTNINGCIGNDTVLVTVSSVSVIFNNTGTGSTGSIQNWTVPAGVTSITIEAFGAEGGGTVNKGLGAGMKGTFTVTPGQVLKILVGQAGTTGSNGTYSSSNDFGGGGGGTFVTDNSNNPLIIAGGGGGRSGASTSYPPSHGLTGTSGGNGSCSLGGTGGGGGGQSSYGAGGGGLTGNGSTSCGSAQGISFINGGAGGIACTSGADGGFGGGGAEGGGGGGGGGGGYSGGGGGWCSCCYDPAGGGGSINNGTNQSNASGVKSGHGQVIITMPGCGNLSVSVSSGSVCPGNCITLFATQSGGTSPYTYDWIPGGDTTQTITVCPTSDTIYMVTITDSAGNTATDTAMVTVNQSSVNNLQASICTGDSILLQGNYQTSAGTYYDTLTSVNGCDSVITTTLTVNSSITIPLTATICTGDSILLQGSYQTTAGTYYDTLTSAIGGCDSIIATTLTVNSSITIPFTAAICSGDSILLQGSYQTTAGTYYDTLTSTIGGCDSIIATTLTVNSSITIPLTAAICSGDSILLQGSYQTTAGTYYDTLTSAIGGCDSIIATTLTVNQSTIFNQQSSICSGDSIFLQGAYQTAAGIYNDTLTNGCDSIIITALTVNPLPVANAGNDVTIFGGESATLNGTGGGTYQWSPSTGLSCNNCADPQANPTETTTYFLSVTDNGCTNIDSVKVTVDVREVKYVPNMFSPNGDGQNDKLFFYGEGIKWFQLVIYDRWGEKIIELSDLSSGWDGTFRGQLLNSAVFVYFLKGEFISANPFEEKGNITLIR